jgi:hypothetical protein
MDAILLIIGIVYGVCRIVIKSIQQCTYFLFYVNLLLVGVNYTDKEPCKFAVNKRQNTNYSFLPGTSKVSCIRRKRVKKILITTKDLFYTNPCYNLKMKISCCKMNMEALATILTKKLRFGNW